ncbi:hypothetical protein [Actinoplanes sp. NPDC051851]|uniref:hypothetical protein n=1 Tax=Actinoplanes sp. NPDC051851 TaxID=3154753 RepID=UPI00342D8804
MLLTEPAPAAIWASLWLAALPALVVLASPHGVRNPRRALFDTIGFLRRREEAREAEHRHRVEEAVSSARYAAELRVAADQAACAVDRWQSQWETAAARSAATFQAWHAADTRLHRTRAAAPFHTPFTDQTPSEYADRERYLHLAVRAAADRGELPTTAVADALTTRSESPTTPAPALTSTPIPAPAPTSDPAPAFAPAPAAVPVGGAWDARLHPAEQELVVHRAAATHLAALHRAARTAERRAWDDLQRATRNRDHLRREGTRATIHAASLRHLLPSTPTHATPSRAHLRAA